MVATGTIGNITIKDMKTITIPKVKNLITARPEGMDFETYKAIRQEQKQMLHGYNIVVGTGINGAMKRRMLGRLDGVLIPAREYHGHCSKDFQIVIK